MKKKKVSDIDMTSKSKEHGRVFEENYGFYVRLRM